MTSLLFMNISNELFWMQVVEIWVGVWLTALKWPIEFVVYDEFISKLWVLFFMFG